MVIWDNDKQDQDRTGLILILSNSFPSKVISVGGG